MIDFIIEFCADVADVFVDLWLNRIVDRFTKKKRKNEAAGKVD